LVIYNNNIQRNIDTRETMTNEVKVLRHLPNLPHFDVLWFK